MAGTGKLETTLNGLLVGAAVVIAGVLVWRETRPSPVAPSTQAFTYDPRWRSLLSVGRPDGELSAEVVIVEFSDLECPFCKTLHEAVAAAEDSLGGVLSRVFVHYPVANHRFNLPAARGAECAHEQDRFFAFVRVVFQEQDSLGLISMATLAHRAGIQDTLGFIDCSKRETFPLIERGRHIGDSLQIPATPTIFVNGWRASGAMGVGPLLEVIANVRRGEEPNR